ncbi:MAG: DUF3127 domain-containing protein [Bacteroidetes bacterium]|nr:DUF3127 domain-containing protein [Bacteroidota bacterium]
MEAIGILKLKSDVVTVNDRFKKRDFVLTIDPTSPYPQHVTFQITQNKVSELDHFNVGDEIKVLFNLRGREWLSPQGETKYFNTIEAWRIEKATGNAPAHSGSAATKSANTNTQETPPFTNTTTVTDDLPF